MAQLTATAKTILDLNDDVLCHVLKFLPLKDQLTLVKCHEHFVDPFEMYAKSSLRKLNDVLRQEAMLTPSDITLFFQIVGKHFQGMRIVLDGYPDAYKEAILAAVITYCYNVEKLDLTGMTNFHQIMVPNMEGLRVLYLHHARIEDDWFETLKLLPNLTQLALINCRQITGRNLHLLSNLSELLLRHCYRLNYAFVENAFSALTKLQSFAFDVGNYHVYSESHSRKFQDLLTHCKNIEILKWNLPLIELRCLTNLNKLKSLRFQFSAENTSEDLAAFIAAKGDELTSLKIYVQKCGLERDHLNLIAKFRNLETLHFLYDICGDPGCEFNDDDLNILTALENLIEFKILATYRITNEGLLNFIDKSRKLKRVMIMMTRIDDGFAEGLIPLLKNSKRPNGHIKFFVSSKKWANFPAAFETDDELKELASFVFKADIYDDPVFDRSIGILLSKVEFWRD